MSAPLILLACTVLALLVSLAADRARTGRALKLAGTRLLKMLPPFLLLFALFSVAIVLLPEPLVARLLGRESGPLGVVLGLGVGSVTLMPGFIAFPLAAALRGRGVPYMVLAAFTSSLMMVGVLTYPLERQYFGRNVTLVRNAASLVIALVVAVVTGLVFGEIGR